MKKFFNAMSDRTSRDLDRIGGKGLTRLQQAADENDTDRIRLLLKRKADINETGLCGESALHRAARLNNYSAARLLIESGADINLTDGQGQTALHNAVLQGNTMIATRLLEAGADVTVADHEGRTAMHMVPRGYEEIFAQLVAQGGDVNALDKQGHPPLNYHLRHDRLVSALINLRADPNLSTTQPSPLVTALSLPLLATHPSVIRNLLAGGGDVNARSTSTREPLIHLAARSGQSALLVEALARKADVSATDPAGMTIAHALAQLPQPDMMRLVLLRAPDLARARAHDGTTPLHHVLNHLTQTPLRGTETHVATLLQLAQLLIEYGADPSIATANGTTLLHEAATRNLTGFVEFLAKHKANFDLRDHQGNAPLNIAISARNVELVDQLLDHGADPDLTDARGWTVLDRLAEKKDRESPIVQRLIVAGGQYNKQLPLYPDLIRPRNGTTPAPANDTTPVVKREDVISPAKKVIKRQPPQN